MDQYELNIEFNRSALETLSNAKQKVAIIRHMDGSASLDVIWLAFRPMMANTVTWVNKFSVYASKSETTGGSSIIKSTVAEASPGILYTFTNGLFYPSVTGEPITESYMAINKMEDQSDIVLGLCQSADSNGSLQDDKPLCAVTALYDELVNLTPTNSYSIFLSADIEDATCVSKTSSDAFKFEFSPENTSLSIYYNETSGKFCLKE